MGDRAVMRCPKCGARLDGWEEDGQSWYRRWVVNARGRAVCADRQACIKRRREPC